MLRMTVSGVLVAAMHSSRAAASHSHASPGRGLLAAVGLRGVLAALLVSIRSSQQAAPTVMAQGGAAPAMPRGDAPPIMAQGGAQGVLNAPQEWVVRSGAMAVLEGLQVTAASSGKPQQLLRRAAAALLLIHPAFIVCF